MGPQKVEALSQNSIGCWICQLILKNCAFQRYHICGEFMSCALKKCTFEVCQTKLLQYFPEHSSFKEYY
jgi:hypothetical protein